MARPIHQNHPMAFRELVAERQPHVFEIAARTVEQNDRRSSCGTKLDQMDAAAGNLDKSPGRRMSLFDASNTECREQPKPAQQRHRRQKYDQDHSHETGHGKYKTPVSDRFTNCGTMTCEARQMPRPSTFSLKVFTRSGIF